MSYAAACSAFQPAPSTSLPAYISPDSPSPPHFCLVSESSASVEGRADKMVSNCWTDDVALKFWLSLSSSLPLSLFLIVTHGLNDWASLMFMRPLLSSWRLLIQRELHPIKCSFELVLYNETFRPCLLRIEGVEYTGVITYDYKAP